MKKTIVTGAACAMLAACGGGAGDAGTSEGAAGESGDGGMSASEIAEEASGGSLRPQAGQYRQQVELVEVNIPGAPPQAQEIMEGMIEQTAEYCLTAEEAAKGYERMAQQSQDGDCTFERFDVDGGTIDAAMSCPVQGGGSMNMTIEGTGRETSSDFTMRMEGDMGGSAPGSMTIKAQHERIGDCPE